MEISIKKKVYNSIEGTVLKCIKSSTITYGVLIWQFIHIWVAKAKFNELPTCASVISNNILSIPFTNNV